MYKSDNNSPRPLLAGVDYAAKPSPPSHPYPEQACKPHAPNPMDSALTRLEALCKAVLSLDIDLADRIAAARPKEDGGTAQTQRPSGGPLDDRLCDLEAHVQRMANRIGELRELFG